MKLAEIISVIESFAPVSLQEKYDNTGLACGDPGMEVHQALLCIDVTEEIVSEAIHHSCDVIISHHPVLFHPLKKLTGTTLQERIMLSAIRNNIALYSAHTNIDNVAGGVNKKISDRLGLQHTKVLTPAEGLLRKLVTFVPSSHADIVRDALFNAGAGHIGAYDRCSFNSEGSGTFRASEGTHPFTGEIGEFHMEKEMRIEVVYPVFLQKHVISSMCAVHPYEEPAYDIVRMENATSLAGAGMVGELPEAATAQDFFMKVKETFTCKVIRCSPFTGKAVKKIALCGGSGSFLLDAALEAKADVFLTADIRYHQFFEADGQIILADIGHYESEQFTNEIFYELLTKNLPNFAIRFSQINSNCITYL